MPANYQCNLCFGGAPITQNRRCPVFVLDPCDRQRVAFINAHSWWRSKNGVVARVLESIHHLPSKFQIYSRRLVCKSRKKWSVDRLRLDQPTLSTLRARLAGEYPPTKTCARKNLGNRSVSVGRGQRFDLPHLLQRRTVRTGTGAAPGGALAGSWPHGSRSTALARCRHRQRHPQPGA